MSKHKDPKDMTTTEALTIIEDMADSADMEAGNDPQDYEMAKKAQALTLAWNALKDVAEQEGCR